MNLSTLSASRKSANGSAAAKYHQQLFSPQGQSALDYLTSDRGLSEATIKAFGLGFVADPVSAHDQYRGRICLPYLTPGGDVMKLRFRAVPPYEGNAKYLDIAGGSPRMFNTSAIVNGGNELVISEGEMDTIALTQMGYKAVGVAGTQAWQPFFRRMLDGFSRIIVTVDNDDGGAGREFANKVSEEMEDQDVVHALMPEGHDVNSAMTDLGVDVVHDLLHPKPENV